MTRREKIVTGIIVALVVLLVAWGLGVKAAFAADIQVEFRHQSNGKTGLYVHALNDSVVAWLVQCSDMTTTLHHGGTAYTPTGWYRPIDGHYGAPCQENFKICGSCQRDALWLNVIWGQTWDYWKYDEEVTNWDATVISDSSPNVQGTVQTGPPGPGTGWLRDATMEVVYTDYSPSCEGVEEACRPDCEADMGKPAQAQSDSVGVAAVSWSQVKALMR